MELGNPPFFKILRWATICGSLEVVKDYLLMQYIIASEKQILLQQALENGHIEIVKLLVGLNFAKINGKSFEPMLIAVTSGHLEIIKYLVDIGFDPFQFDTKPLIRSVEKGHTDIFKYLFQFRYSHIYFTTKDKVFLNSVLAQIVRTAIKYDRVNVLSHIICCGYTFNNDFMDAALIRGRMNVINYFSTLGLTFNDISLVCTSVVESGKIEVIKWLCESGISGNLKQIYDLLQSKTGLDNNVKVAKYLVENGCNYQDLVQYKEWYGNGISHHHIFWHNRHPAFIKYLFDFFTRKEKHNYLLNYAPLLEQQDCLILHQKNLLKHKQNKKN
jgi:hypothetical protein